MKFKYFHLVALNKNMNVEKPRSSVIVLQNALNILLIMRFSKALLVSVSRGWLHSDVSTQV